MASIVLLDSSIIIDAINDRNNRVALIEQRIGQGILLACCPINVTEIYMGMRPDEAQKTEEVLASLEFYPVTWEIAKYAGHLYRQCRQKGHTLALPDLTIAAVAILNRLQLITDNQKDFPMQELQLYPLQ